MSYREIIGKRYTKEIPIERLENGELPKEREATIDVRTSIGEFFIKYKIQLIPVVTGTGLWSAQHEVWWTVNSGQFFWWNGDSPITYITKESPN